MITHGDRIAQMAVVPFWQADFEEVSELTKLGVVPEGLGVLESEDTMKYYYCDSWRVLIVDENNDAVTFSIGEGDYARGFCDGLEQVGFVKAGADLLMRIQNYSPVREIKRMPTPCMSMQMKNIVMLLMSSMM
ncbi:MAG: hypothetical protein ACLRWM_01740 [Streptococcus sp.]